MSALHGHIFENDSRARDSSNTKNVVSKGEAERLIRHLELTENNYTTAWNTLRDRYDNKRVLMSAIIHKLFSWTNLQAEAKSIRDFHDVINESLSALENIGINKTNWDPILLYVLIKKLYRQTHHSYEQSLHNPKELQTISHFLKVLQLRFQSLEAVGGKKKLNKSQQSQHLNRVDVQYGRKVIPFAIANNFWQWVLLID